MQDTCAFEDWPCLSSRSACSSALIPQSEDMNGVLHENLAQAYTHTTSLDANAQHTLALKVAPIAKLADAGDCATALMPDKPEHVARMGMHCEQQALEHPPQKHAIDVVRLGQIVDIVHALSCRLHSIWLCVIDGCSNACRGKAALRNRNSTRAVTNPGNEMLTTLMNMHQATGKSTCLCHRRC
eukprot:6487236-Amphidinium_carterae.1